MKVHFINVGHGDTVFIEFDSGKTALVDINRSSTISDKELSEIISNDVGIYEWTKYFSGDLTQAELLEKAGYTIALTDPIDYLKGKSIFRFISTHPHMDHLTGLNNLLNNNEVTNFWGIQNSYKQKTIELTDEQKLDRKVYQSLLQGNKTGITSISPVEGAARPYYDLPNDNIKILYPYADMEEPTNINNLSYVILLSSGSQKILLAGDAEKEAWDYLVENHSEDLKNLTILKAAHHGRKSGYHQEAVKLMAPQYTILSVGKKDPASDAHSNYDHYTKQKVMSTRWYGNIVFTLTPDGVCVCETEKERKESTSNFAREGFYNYSKVGG